MAWKPIPINDPATAFEYWYSQKKPQESLGYIELNLDEIQCKFPDGIYQEVSNFFKFIYQLKGKFVSVDDYGGMIADGPNSSVFFKDKIIAYPRMPYLLEQYNQNGGYNDPLSIYDSPVYGKPTVHPGKGRFYILNNFTNVTKDKFFMFDTFGKFKDRFIKEFITFEDMNNFLPSHTLTFFTVDRYGTKILEPFYRSKKTMSKYTLHINQVVTDMIEFFKTYEIVANFDLNKYNYDRKFFTKFTKRKLYIESTDSKYNDLAFTHMIYNLNKEDSRFKITLNSVL